MTSMSDHIFYDTRSWAQYVVKPVGFPVDDSSGAACERTITDHNCSTCWTSESIPWNERMLKLFFFFYYNNNNNKTLAILGVEMGVRSYWLWELFAATYMRLIRAVRFTKHIIRLLHYCLHIHNTYVYMWKDGDWWNDLRIPNRRTGGGYGRTVLNETHMQKETMQWTHVNPNPQHPRDMSRGNEVELYSQYTFYDTKQANPRPHHHDRSR